VWAINYLLSKSIGILAEYLRSELQLELEGQLGDLIASIAWSPDRRGWAVSAANGEVAWYSGLEELAVLRPGDGKSIERLDFSSDGQWLAAGGQSGQLFIWNCADRQHPPQLANIIPINKWIEHLSWHPSGAELVIGYGDRVKLWDAIAMQEIVTWRFDRSSIFDLAWHPDGKSIAVAGYKGVQIWSPGDNTAQIHHLAVDTASLKIAWERSGRYLAAGNLDRTITIVDWQHPDDPWILQGCPGKIRDLQWLAGTMSPYLAVASATAIVLWNLTPNLTDWTGRLLEGHQNTVEALSVHPHLPLLLAGDNDGYTCLWSKLGEIEQILANIVSVVTTLTWHPDGRQLAIGSRNGKIELWQLSV
jgi:WD40 repeat protein